MSLNDQGKIAKTPFIFGAVGSLLSGFMVIKAFFFGFGSYFVRPVTHGWATSGFVSNVGTAFLAVLALGLVISGLGYRGFRSIFRVKTGAFSFGLSIVVSALLFVTVGVYLTNDVNGPPLFGPNSFYDLSVVIAFSYLTFINLIVLGVLQMPWGLTHVKM